ncbi:uncharacterized protein BX663DRAFT_520013 [Cokeromyces recurvatus]|uniref:uncharacterized protein n=1 Tax=Cokeromyces recurvatus TaxID=90255 RepID=UPI002220AA92|nr:uncharacterized protein BX663DRAFT_520013 [Cokeromyces recurvatus]KAI7899682.1 hypothetical protein BX663DRAFT_520013 [Cokeromyces recurvatus]
MSPANNYMYYNPHHFYPQNIISPVNTTPTTTSSSSVSSLNRLEQIQAQLELARNFYDDFEFCPVQCSSEVLEHRDRIHQRLYSPHTSPRTSPSMSPNNSPTKRRAIPIINPSNMTPVIPPQQQPSQQHQNFMLRNNRYSHSNSVLVQ